MSWQRKNETPHRIVCAYDSETNNVADMLAGVRAFPVCHQFGYIKHDIELASITVGNVESVCEVEVVRHTTEAYARFDRLIEEGLANGYIPVVLVHNLGFDMHGLSEYLNSHEVRVLAKSCTKPITFTILDESGNPELVFWDTLVFWGKSLETLGNDCGYPKLKGYWDYNRQRTPETPLTELEVLYATHDIYVMFAYMGYYLRQNDFIDENALACSIVTKTGAVRYKRKKLLDSAKGNGQQYNAGRFWNFQNRKELPKSDDELFTMHACMRGGFTFCARETAGVPFNLDNSGYTVAGFDASSQHPAQMVSHLYPEQFMEADPRNLDIDCQIIECYNVDHVLDNWAFPFPVAFMGLFEFDNLQYKPGSVFEQNGISPLAYSRVSDRPIEVDQNNQQGSEFNEMIGQLGYRDWAEGETHCFGKLESAAKCRLWLTELAYWEMCQAFKWDSCHAVCGYDTMHFTKPTDMTILSVMEFFKAKDVFKAAKNAFEKGEEIPNIEELKKVAPVELVSRMMDGTATDHDVKSQYLSIKADLNSLFGIEATNEAKQDMVLTTDGLETQPVNGIEDLPNNPKAWYQLGQRIVGWSRIAQICAMELAAPHVDAIINGDTDSVKFLVAEDKLDDLQSSLDRLGTGIDIARKYVTDRVKRNYPDRFYDLKGIGHYELEFTVSRFFASWNKAYCSQSFDKRDGQMHFSFTLAGIPTDATATDPTGEKFANSYNDLADTLYKRGWSFEEVTNLLLGYNITIDSSITKLNGRYAPKWGEWFYGDVTDCYGKTYHVEEPAAMALSVMPKTIGATDEQDNDINLAFAKANNPFINSDPVLIIWDPGEEPTIERI